MNGANNELKENAQFLFSCTLEKWDISWVCNTHSFLVFLGTARLQLFAYRLESVTAATMGTQDSKIGDFNSLSSNGSMASLKIWLKLRACLSFPSTEKKRGGRTTWFIRNYMKGFSAVGYFLLLKTVMIYKNDLFAMYVHRYR